MTIFLSSSSVWHTVDIRAVVILRMAHMSYLLLLALLFGPLQTEADECEAPSAVEAIEDTEDTFVLTKDICLDGLKSTYMSENCCNAMLELEGALGDCLSGTDFSSEDDDDQFTQWSIFTECYYRTLSYIKGNRQLNFDQVKADAANLDDPLKQQYLLDTYTFCACNAKRSIQKLDVGMLLRPNKIKWRMELKKPYFYYVFMCFIEYPETNQCPYFKYGSPEEDVDAKCDTYADQCKELVKE